MLSFELVAKEKRLTVTQEFEVQSKEVVPVAKFEPSAKTRDILVMKITTQGWRKLDNDKMKVEFVEIYEIMPQQKACELTFQRYITDEVIPFKSFVMSPTGEITKKEESAR